MRVVMRQPRWFFRSGMLGLLTAATAPVLAQQVAPQAAPAQQTVQDAVQQSEQQAVQQAVQQAGQHAAQQSLIGTVSLDDATVTGASSTVKNRAILVWNGTVVAKDHVAYVELARGGSVRVCATSGLHLTVGSPAAADAAPPQADPVALSPANANSAVAKLAAPPAPLMLSLDRGALEVRMNASASDLLMTPDLRIGFSEPGPLDLHVRVTQNGDTCVENRIVGLSVHPSLDVASLFGDETYHVLPGQHVLFERASLHEVVDNESSPCGCPEAPVVPPMVEAGNISLKPGEKVSNSQVEAQHPFPAAVSQGLAPPPEVPQAPPGQLQTQIATTLRYPNIDPDAGANKATAANPVPQPATPPPPPANKRGFFHDVGRFFKHVFG